MRTVDLVPWGVMLGGDFVSEYLLLPKQKPHILLIVLDTLRRDHLGAYGYHRVTSPAFDALAESSTLFTRAISPAQWTIPAHASIFTGVYPSTHRVTEASHRLPDQHTTVAEILQAHDYHTVAFCNNPLVGILDNDFQRGFDAFYNYAGAAPNRPQQTQRSEVRKTLTRSWQRFARRVSNHFAQSDWLFRVSVGKTFTPLWTRSINYKGHTRHAVDDLIAYWDQHTADPQRPVFGFLNLMGAHFPYQPPQEVLRRIAPEFAADPAVTRFIRSFNNEAARWASPNDPPLADWQSAALNAFYDAEIAYQDDQLGRLLEAVGAGRFGDNTLVIVTADHGEGHGDHGFMGHSFVVYQELVHVPLVIAHPEHFAAGDKIDTLVSTRRIFHTILDMAGIPAGVPQNDEQTLSLAQSADADDGMAFAEAYPPQTFVNMIRHRNPNWIDAYGLRDVRRAVYQNGHKLVVRGEAVEGLFAVVDDPNEQHNLAAASPQKTATLQDHLAAFMQTQEKSANQADGNLKIDHALAEHLRALGYLK